MSTNKIKNIFTRNKALLEGHFVLSSGLHSDTYFQSALVLQHPKVAQKLAKLLAAEILSKVTGIDVVVSPALGGIVIGQEVARQLALSLPKVAIGNPKVRAVFCERVEGKLTLRRGFEIANDEKCLVVEDVITTGLSTNEVITVVKSLGGNVVAVASLVDRSGGKVDFGVPRFSLLSLEVKSYKPEECPLCAKGLEAVKPGSRK
jgi:orotate phosphoribosyltransferase